MSRPAAFDGMMKTAFRWWLNADIRNWTMSRCVLIRFTFVFFCVTKFVLFNCHGTDLQLTVSNACEVLKNFRGEYSYGGWGMGAESNNGELATWIIFHSPNAAETFVKVYPECHESGKAYVLAALYHLDKRAFTSLTNAFCSEPGEIVTAAGCCGGSMTRKELVVGMQKRGWGFDPSRKPDRRSQWAFFPNTKDVYAERRRWEEEQREQQALGNALLASTPRLAAFTNLFRVEGASANNGSSSGAYFNSEWSANFLPREKLPFEAMVEAIFPKTSNVVDVGIKPEQALKELKTLTDLPFIKHLDTEIGMQCVRIRLGSDRLQWESAEAEEFEKRLHTGVPPKDWVNFIVDVGRHEHRMICFYHPKDTDLYVVEDWLFESPNWREQYKKITGKTPKKILDEWGNPEPKYLPVVDKEGNLRLLN